MTQTAILSKEKILVSAFNSSQALKDEIGHRILNRINTDWDLVELDSQGSFIYLVFRQRVSHN